MHSFIWVLWLHFFGDFFFQFDKMATNKSSSFFWLGLHSLVYTVFLVFFGWKFALVNGVAHFIIDAVSSRGTSYLYAMGQRHWFFTLIGLDQTLHLSLLYLTFNTFKW